jgi:hypothetical protein
MGVPDPDERCAFGACVTLVSGNTLPAAPTAKINYGALFALSEESSKSALLGQMPGTFS